jgi:hypothetical protein
MATDRSRLTAFPAWTALATHVDRKWTEPPWVTPARNGSAPLRL